MKLIRWSYTKKYNIKAIFDRFPNSAVIFRQIHNYYFVYTVKWDIDDPLVKRAELQEMEELLNIELDTYHYYKNRKSSTIFENKESNL